MGVARHRIARRAMRWASRLKKWCYHGIAMSAIGFVLAAVSPGGLSGPSGPMAIGIATITLMVSLLCGLLGLVLGGSAMAARLGRSRPDVGNFTAPRSTECIGHDELWDNEGAVEVAGHALETRGAEAQEMFPEDPDEFLALVPRLARVRSFTLEERMALLPPLCSAVCARDGETSTWKLSEEARAYLVGGVPRLWIHPDLTPAQVCAGESARGRSGSRLVAVDSRWTRAHGRFEKFVVRGFGVLIGAALVAKIAWAIFGPGRGASLGPFGFTMRYPFLLLIALLGVFYLLKALLAARRRKRHTWRVAGEPIGLRAEPPAHLRTSPFDVDARSCLVWIDPAVDDERDPPIWNFAFAGVEEHLICEGFDPRGTPWEMWIEEWRRARNDAGSAPG